MAELEQPLSVGNLTPVVRVGDTVRRAQGPWSPAVHALLHHLERVGFSEAPRFLGVDMQQREILSFLSGVTGFFPDIWREASLVAAARLLRRYHDATVGFQPPPDACWQMAYPNPAQHEVICHNDAAPYNLVFVDGLPTGMLAKLARSAFDFDLAGPGPRLWDLAYAVYWFAPRYPHDLPHARGLDDLAQTGRRVQLFCAAYGVAPTPRLLDLVEARLVEMCERLSGRAAAGDPVAQRMLAEGHLSGYQRSLTTFREWRPALEQQLFA